MTFTHHADIGVADWISRCITAPEQLIFFGPGIFEAHARIRFIPDPTNPEQSEADVQLPDDHRSDIDQTRRALHTLSRYTLTPNECYFCIWNGYSNIQLPVDTKESDLLSLPHRQYVLYSGSLEDLDDWEERFGSGSGDPIPPPAFVWPSDRRWCFASDVDPHWAGVGGELAAIDALIGDEELDVVRASPSEMQPLYR